MDASVQIGPVGDANRPLGLLARLSQAASPGFRCLRAARSPFASPGFPPADGRVAVVPPG